MANARSSDGVVETPDVLQPAFKFAAQWVDGFYQAQKMQIDALSSWQQSLGPSYSPFPDLVGMQLEFLRRAQAQVDDLRDAWVSHWAGGVPIDA